MVFFSKIGKELKKKTKKSIRITPAEKKGLKKAPFKTHRAIVKVGSRVNIGRTLGTTTKRLKTEKPSFKSKIPKIKRKRRTVRIIHIKGEKAKKKKKINEFGLSFEKPF